MTFVERLRQIFAELGDMTAADIARRINVSHATATNYLEGRLPAAEILIRIVDQTKVSLNWLLTGEGPKHIAPRNALVVNLTDEEHAIIRERAEWLKVSAEQLVADYIRQGLEQNQMLPYPPIGEQLIEVPLYETIEELPSEKLGDAVKQLLNEVKRRASA